MLFEIEGLEKNFKLKIKTSKEIKYINYKDNINAFDFYLSAKKLKPIPEIGEKPYLKLLNLVSPIDLGYHKGGGYYNTSYMRTGESIKNKHVDLLEVENKTKVISYHDNDFFRMFIKDSKEYKILVATPSLVVSSVENFIQYRELHSPHISYNDKIIYAELKKWVTSQYIPVPDDVRENFKKLYPNVDYQIINDNKIVNDLGKLDFIDFSSILFEYSKKKITAYRSSFTTLEMLIFSFENLKVNGLLRFQVRQLDVDLFLDIITLAAKYFEKSYVFRSPLSKAVYDYKSIVLKNFKGISKEELSELKEVYSKLLKKENYIERILSKKINRELFQKLYDKDNIDKVETWKKMIEAYQKFSEDSQKAANYYIIKQLINSIQWLENNNITYNSKFKQIDKIYFDNNKFSPSYHFEKIIKNQEEKPLINNFNIYKFNFFLIKTLDVFRFIKIDKKTNPYKNLDEDLDLFEFLTLLKIDKNSNFVYDKKYQKSIDKYTAGKKEDKKEEFLITDNIKLEDFEKYDKIIYEINIIEDYNKLNKGDYIFKSYSNLYNANIFIACLDKKETNINLYYNINNLCKNLNQIINYILFYYHNEVFLKKNQTKILEIKNNVLKDWKKEFQ